MDTTTLIVGLSEELKRQQSWLRWAVEIPKQNTLAVYAWSPLRQYTVEAQFYIPAVLNLIDLERGLRVGEPGRPLRPLAELVTTLTDGEFRRAGHGYGFIR